jgi:hypothetical protein
MKKCGMGSNIQGHSATSPEEDKNRTQAKEQKSMLSIIIEIMQLFFPGEIQWDSQVHNLGPTNRQKKH